MTSEAPGTLPKHKLHVCSQMETNGCLPWRPHKENAVTFTVKCNLLFNMQQTEMKESWNEFQQRAVRGPGISSGEPRPFKDCASPTQLNCKLTGAYKQGGKELTGSILCYGSWNWARVTSYCLILEASWAKSEIQYWLIEQKKQYRLCLWKGYATHPS